LDGSGPDRRRPTIRRATPQDAADLAAFGRQAFTDTFGRDNTPEDLALYLAAAYGPEIQRAELVNPAVSCWLAESGSDIAGYALLRRGPAPSTVDSDSAIEVGRLYVGREFIRGGIGSLLMRAALDEARETGIRTIWLGVWEHNLRAIAFYRRWGFDIVGRQPFLLGRDLQQDYVMARPVQD
jgi:ribosomal protein S18 acetylase RimI-like enzyme